MCHPPLRYAFDVEDVVQMVRRAYDGRVAFHDGDEELAGIVARLDVEPVAE
jgi:hypothetical protein